MPDFIVLKKTAETDTGEASDWTPCVIARDVEDEEAAAKQGYDGAGIYKVLSWEEDVQIAVRPGPLEVQSVSREELAKAAEARAGKGAG